MKVLLVFRNQYFWLGLILVLGLILRLYKIDNPIADWHSWRQADTAAVARNFLKEGFNPFFPKHDDMSPPGNSRPNPERYRFVEFPIYNSLVYFLYLLNGGVDERLARLVSVFMSLGSTVFLYLITKRVFGRFTAFTAAFVFTTLPFNIYFSRVVLPEPTLVFFSLGMFYFIDRWIWENNRKLYFLSIIFTASAFLIKPMAVFYLLPLAYSFYKKEGRLWPIPKRYFLWGFFSFLPFFAWRLWINRYPEGIPESGWLFNGNGIRFRPAFWRWIVGDRLGREILTATGTVLFFLGLFRKPGIKEGLLLHLLALSSLLYLVVFATGNVQHDYYQTLIIPALSVFTARGFVILLRGETGLISRIWTIPASFLLLALTIYLGWLEVKGLYQINNPVIIEAGRVADKLLPQDAVVVAPYNGDTAFLYQVNRPGWPVISTSIEEMKKQYGVSHYVSVNYDSDTKVILEKYKVLEANPRFVIVDLMSQK